MSGVARRKPGDLQVVVDEPVNSVRTNVDLPMLSRNFFLKRFLCPPRCECTDWAPSQSVYRCVCLARANEFEALQFELPLQSPRLLERHVTTDNFHHYFSSADAALLLPARGFVHQWHLDCM